MQNSSRFFKDIDTFSVRSQKSYSNVGISRTHSIESEQLPGDEISDTILKMITQEKNKYATSKTDNRMMRTSINVKAQRFYSISTVKYSRPSLQLPFHIDRILTSAKRYPNVPLLQENQDQLDSIYGAFFGFLIGDITGAYMAYTTYNTQALIPHALLMNGAGTYNLGAGQGTDQTQLMFTMAYSLIEGQGTYNQNIISKNYVEWFQSKPFNFSAIFALAVKDMKRIKALGGTIDQKKYGKILTDSSKRNHKQESSIGLIRILPLTLFSLKFSEANFQTLIRQQLNLICPNQLVIQSGLVYAKILRIIFLTKDQQRAFYQASKWIYQHGCQKIKQLWKIVQKGIEIPSKGNMGKLKTSFTYACIQINKRQQNFIQSLITTLSKGGDCQANSAIVMALVGAMVGYNGIPGYFKQKIINSRMKDSTRPRDQKYSPHMVVQIIQDLIKLQNTRYFCIH